MSVTAETRVFVVDGFGDPRVSAEAWRQLLARGSTREVFLTREWAEAWATSFRRGTVLLVLAEDACPRTLAPFFVEEGMVYFLGSGGSDRLDFVGEIGDAAALSELLGVAAGLVPEFRGFRLYHVPERSPTCALLPEAAELLGLKWVDEGRLSAPVIDLAEAPSITRKKSLVRHENGFRRTGRLEVEHVLDGRAVAEHLDDFFEQHIRRWQLRGIRSLFLDVRQRTFYGNLTRLAASSGWLRFTRVVWEGAPIAYHFGFCLEGRFLWYKPTFEPALARRSPGEVLLRQLLVRALEEEAKVFDLGLGDEPFKDRFATRVEHVRTFGLYAP